MSKYQIIASKAKMPNSCWGRYYHVAVVEITPGFAGVPKMISERARGVEAIVWTSGPVCDGKTERCAYARAVSEAKALIERLSAPLAA
jgi:hypothetical protein